MTTTQKTILGGSIGLVAAALLYTPPSEPTLFVTPLAWTQHDACAGWEVRAGNLVVTNIPRPLYGHTFTNTIVSPHRGLHTILAYTR